MSAFKLVCCFWFSTLPLKQKGLVYCACYIQEHLLLRKSQIPNTAAVSSSTGNEVCGGQDSGQGPGTVLGTQCLMNEWPVLAWGHFGSSGLLTKPEQQSGCMVFMTNPHQKPSSLTILCKPDTPRSTSHKIKSAGRSKGPGLMQSPENFTWTLETRVHVSRSQSVSTWKCSEGQETNHLVLIH